MPRSFPKELFPGNLVALNEAARIAQSDSHSYSCNVHPEWSYGPAAHGGFLIALMWKAIALHFDTTLQEYAQPHTFTFHIEFLRPCAVGPVTITIKDVRLGKATSTVHATLIQKGSERCVAYATNAGPRAALNTISQPMDYKLEPDPPPIDFDKVLNGLDKHWIRYDVGRDQNIPNAALHNHIFCVQRHPPPNKRITQQWITPRLESDRWTTPTLGIICDHSVPPLEAWMDDAPHSYFSIPKRAEKNEREGKGTWEHPPWLAPRYYPTVNMSIEVKRQLPPKGEKWLSVRCCTKEVVEGRVDIDVTVWDAQGRLVAIAQSLSYVVDIGRAPAAKLGKPNATGQSRM